MSRPVASSPDALARMKRQRQRDTRPELIVRKVLHRLGMRYRTHNRELPGSPDIANRGRRWAVFVHGCYWHHHEGCPRATIPRNNRDFWIEKFEANRARDARKTAELERLGYEVIVVWECETKNNGALESRLRGYVERILSKSE